MNRVILEILYRFLSIDAHNQYTKNIYRPKVCQTVGKLVDTYNSNLQFLLIVGSEVIRIFNYCGGNNNDGRRNNLSGYYLDLLNRKTVRFSKCKLLCRSPYLIQRKLNISMHRDMHTHKKGFIHYLSVNTDDNLMGELNELAKELIKKNL